MEHRKEIDGLRALAVLPVILFHAGFETFGGGFVGVDVFFVISGYLITTIILAELEQEKFSIVNFYERRARRILPALFLVMLACLPFAWLWLIPSDMKDFSQSVAAVTVFASNILFWRESGYFDTAAELKPLLHTWSLAVEEQYYVLFPVFLMLTWRLGKRWVLAMLAVIAVASLALAHWGATAKPAATFFLLPTRGWELLIGAFVAFHFSNANKWQPSKAVSDVGSALGLALLNYAIFAYSKQTPFPSLYALVPTVGTALIILLATEETFVGRLLGNKLFVGIGLISYSAYLWHQPMFAFARHRSLEEPSQLVFSLLAFASLVLAYFSWRYVETPFRRKDWIGQKQVFAFGFVCSVLCFGAGLAGHLSKGFESRIPYELRDDIAFQYSDIYNGSRVSDSSCSDKLNLKLLSEEVCLASSNAPRVLFAGDSHAMALYSSIYGKQLNADALIISAHSCPLYPNLYYTPTFLRGWDNNCTAISNKVISVANQFGSIDTLVLANSFAKADNEKSRYFLNEKNLTNAEAFQAGYDHLLNSLHKLGKRIIFVVDVPHLKYDPRLCIQRPALFEDEVSCAYSKIELEERRKSYLREVASLKARHPYLLIYDPTEIFCGGEVCDIKDGLKSLYNDKHHISVWASYVLMQDMLKKDFVIY